MDLPIVANFHEMKYDYLSFTGFSKTSESILLLRYLVSFVSVSIFGIFFHSNFEHVILLYGFKQGLLEGTKDRTSRWLVL